MNEFLKPEEYKELDELMTYILGEMLETKDKVFIREGIISYANRWHEMQVNAAEQRTSKCNKHIVTNSLPKIDLDKADELVKKTDYACYACEDTEEINWGDAASFFIEGYNYAIKKFRQ